MQIQMDFLSANYEKFKQKRSVTDVLHFYYKYIKCIDFLPNKDKI